MSLVLNLRQTSLDAILTQSGRPSQILSYPAEEICNRSSRRCPGPTLCPGGHKSVSRKRRIFSNMQFGLGLALFLVERGRTAMQLVITFMSVVAGLAFSIAVALVVEEWIFGQVFRVFFADPTTAKVPAGLVLQPVRVKSQQR
jgi:hypothetical protein